MSALSVSSADLSHTASPLGSGGASAYYCDRSCQVDDWPLHASLGKCGELKTSQNGRRNGSGDSRIGDGISVEKEKLQSSPFRASSEDAGQSSPRQQRGLPRSSQKRTRADRSRIAEEGCEVAGLLVPDHLGDLYPLHYIDLPACASSSSPPDFYSPRSSSRSHNSPWAQPSSPSTATRFSSAEIEPAPSASPTTSDLKRTPMKRVKSEPAEEQADVRAAEALLCALWRGEVRLEPRQQLDVSESGRNEGLSSILIHRHGLLKLQAWYDTKTNHVRLRSLECQNLPAAQSATKTSDPFVVTQIMLSLSRHEARAREKEKPSQGKVVSIGVRGSSKSLYRSAPDQPATSSLSSVSSPTTPLSQLSSSAIMTPLSPPRPLQLSGTRSPPRILQGVSPQLSPPRSPPRSLQQLSSVASELDSDRPTPLQQASTSPVKASHFASASSSASRMYVAVEEALRPCLKDTYVMLLAGLIVEYVTDERWQVGRSHSHELKAAPSYPFESPYAQQSSPGLTAQRRLESSSVDATPFPLSSLSQTGTFVANGEISGGRVGHRRNASAPFSPSALRFRSHHSTVISPKVLEPKATPTIPGTLDPVWSDECDFQWPLPPAVLETGGAYLMITVNHRGLHGKPRLLGSLHLNLSHLPHRSRQPRGTGRDTQWHPLYPPQVLQLGAAAAKGADGGFLWPDGSRTDANGNVVRDPVGLAHKAEQAREGSEAANSGGPKRRRSQSVPAEPVALAGPGDGDGGELSEQSDSDWEEGMGGSDESYEELFTPVHENGLADAERSAIDLLESPSIPLVTQPSPVAEEGSEVGDVEEGKEAESEQQDLEAFTALLTKPQPLTVEQLASVEAERDAAKSQAKLAKEFQQSLICPVPLTPSQKERIKQEVAQLPVEPLSEEQLLRHFADSIVNPRPLTAAQRAEAQALVERVQQEHAQRLAQLAQNQLARQERERARQARRAKRELRWRDGSSRLVADGTVRMPSGVIVRRDGLLRYPDGSVQSPLWPIPGARQNDQAGNSLLPKGCRLLLNAPKSYTPTRRGSLGALFMGKSAKAPEAAGKDGKSKAQGEQISTAVYVMGVPGQVVKERPTSNLGVTLGVLRVGAYLEYNTNPLLGYHQFGSSQRLSSLSTGSNSSDSSNKLSSVSRNSDSGRTPLAGGPSTTPVPFCASPSSLTGSMSFSSFSDAASSSSPSVNTLPISGGAAAVRRKSQSFKLGGAGGAGPPPLATAPTPPSGLGGYSHLSGYFGRAGSKEHHVGGPETVTLKILVGEARGLLGGNWGQDVDLCSTYVQLRLKLPHSGKELDSTLLRGAGEKWLDPGALSHLPTDTALHPYGQGSQLASSSPHSLSSSGTPSAKSLRQRHSFFAMSSSDGLPSPSSSLSNPSFLPFRSSSPFSHGSASHALAEAERRPRIRRRSMPLISSPHQHTKPLAPPSSAARSPRRHSSPFNRPQKISATPRGRRSSGLFSLLSSPLSHSPQKDSRDLKGPGREKGIEREKIASFSLTVTQPSGSQTRRRSLPALPSSSAVSNQNTPIRRLGLWADSSRPHALGQHPRLPMRTKVKRRTNDPVWNAKFSFQIPVELLKFMGGENEEQLAAAPPSELPSLAATSPVASLSASSTPTAASTGGNASTSETSAAAHARLAEPVLELYVLNLSKNEIVPDPLARVQLKLAQLPRAHRMEEKHFAQCMEWYALEPVPPRLWRLAELKRNSRLLPTPPSSHLKPDQANPSASLPAQPPDLPSAAGGPRVQQHRSPSRSKSLFAFPSPKNNQPVPNTPEQVAATRNSNSPHADRRDPPHPFLYPPTSSPRRRLSAPHLPSVPVLRRDKK